MWFDDIDVGGRGIVQPAKGPLGRTVRELRHNLFMSQAQVAEAAGATQTAVSRLERGAPNWRLFCAIVDALGGVPVVSVERKQTERDLYARLFGPGAEDDPFARPA